MTEITRTATHEFYIQPCIYARQGDPEMWQVEYRSINPKTGEPWQASKRVTDGATIEPKGWENRPIAYPTIEAAREAANRQKAKFIKRAGR